MFGQNLAQLGAWCLMFLAVGFPLQAQDHRGPSSDRFFGYLDRNHDGKVDEEELKRAPGHIREAFEGAGLKKGFDKAQFEKAYPKAMESMRRRHDDERSGRRRSGDSRRPGIEKFVPKERQRVTVDLPETYQLLDLNFDGQLTLAEWPRNDRATFLRYDLNHDGFLTPRELRYALENPPPEQPAPVAAATPAAATGTATTATPATTAPVAAAAAPQAASGPTAEQLKYYQYVFGVLDRNKDGKLTEDEWKQSKKTRKEFEKAGVQLKFPVNAEQFVAVYPPEK